METISQMKTAIALLSVSVFSLLAADVPEANLPTAPGMAPTDKFRVITNGHSASFPASKVAILSANQTFTGSNNFTQTPTVNGVPVVTNATGSQTPLVADVNAASHAITNASSITVGSLPTASSDSKITIARNVDDTVAGNAHAFSDSSLINRSNTIAYNSFDARCALIGTNNYEHYAGFQSLPTYGSSGNIGNYYGWYNGLGVTNGIVTNYYGIYLTTPNSTAPGAISNCYQLYMASPSGVYGNWGIFQADNGGVGNYLGYNTVIGPAHTLGIGFGTTNPSISSTLTINIGNASIGTNTPAPTQGLLVQGLTKLRGSTVIGSVNGTGFGGLEIGTNAIVASTSLNMLLLSAQSEGLHSEKRIDFNLNNGTLYDQAYIGAGFDTGLTDGYLAFGNRSGSAVAQRMLLSGAGNLGLQGNLTVTNSILCSNITASATVTATNGFYYVPQNNGTNPANSLQPAFAWGSMMGYTTNLINGGANTYQAITNFTVARTNQFGANLSTGTLTNLIAGFYRIGIHLSGVAVDAGALIEGDLFLNGVARDEVSFLSAFDPGTPRLKGMSAMGILYITNNTPITFQVKSSGAGGVNVYRSQLVIGTP